MLDTSKIPVERIEGYNNHITNCITKIPQDIKLEINNGNIVATDTFTVYKGDGSTYTITASTSFSHATSAGTFMLIWTGTAARHQNINTCFSGSTAPAQGSFSGRYAVWYDTTNKVIKLTNDGGSTWIGDNSFPLCVYTSNGTSATSIHQIFNGFGYIGSTVFALPGVEGLVPNGFNEDGSLNNILCTINDVKIANTIAGWNNHWYLHLLNENSIAYHPYELYFNQTSSPISMGQTSYWYNPNENMIYYSDDFGITWNSNRKITPFLDIIQDQEKIISITPKLVYQNNTKNDFNKKFQVVSELPTTPEVGVFYFVKE